MAGALGNVNPALLARLREGWEVVNNRWNQWVMNYSRGQQLDVLRNLGFSSPSWQDLAILLAGALSTLALVGAGWAWWDQHRVDPWVRQMQRLRKALLTLSIETSNHEAPRALAARVRGRFGAHGEALAAQLDALDRQRYGRSNADRPDKQLTRRFVAQARRMRLHARG